MITTLVLSAAGLHGLMYVGAWRLLEERGATAHVRNVFGCSFGAIVGLMVALGFSADEMEEVIRGALCERGLPGLCLADLRTLWERCGLLDESFMTGLIRDAVSRKFPGVLDMDFLTLSKLTGRNLVVVASNITRNREEVLSVDTTPDLSVARAVAMSACLPVMFRPIVYKGCSYLDGGIWNYLPTSHVTDPDHAVLVLCCGPMTVPDDKQQQHVSFGSLVGALIANFILPRYNESFRAFTRTWEFSSTINHRIIEHKIRLRRGSVPMEPARVDGLFKQGYEQAVRLWDSTYDAFD